MRRLILLAVLLSGCAVAGSSSLREELANQGPMPLSPDNPYISSNLFLAQEIQSSETVDGFIKHRGTPDALQVSKRSLKPHRVYLFYFDKNEGYLLEEFRDDWIIRGPEEIPKEYMGQLAGFPQVGRKAALTANPYQRQTVSSPLEELSETNNEQSKEEIFRELEAGLPTERVYTSASGDIIHKVKYPGETLRLISGWYTGDPANAKRVARINGMENPNLLNLGVAVRIPRYLLKTTTPLPPEEIQKYIRDVTSRQRG